MDTANKQCHPANYKHKRTHKHVKRHKSFKHILPGLCYCGLYWFLHWRSSCYVTEKGQWHCEGWMDSSRTVHLSSAANMPKRTKDNTSTARSCSFSLFLSNPLCSFYFNLYLCPLNLTKSSQIQLRNSTWVVIC